MRYLFAALAVLAFSCPAFGQTFTVTTRWQAVTQFEDGSPIERLAGYMLYYSAQQRPAKCDHPYRPNPTATAAERSACAAWVSAAGKVEIAATTQHLLTDQQLTPGTRYYFAVTARNEPVEGIFVQSGFSNEATAVTPDVREPAAPKNVTVEITFQLPGGIGSSP